jgi:hypothetical protein
VRDIRDQWWLPSKVDGRAAPPPAPPAPTAAPPPTSSPPPSSPASSAPRLRGGSSGHCGEAGDAGEGQSVGADRSEAIDHDHGHGGRDRHDAAPQSPTEAGERRFRRGNDRVRHLFRPPRSCRAPRLAGSARLVVAWNFLLTTPVHQIGSKLESMARNQGSCQAEVAVVFNALQVQTDTCDEVCAAASVTIHPIRASHRTHPYVAIARGARARHARSILVCGTRHPEPKMNEVTLSSIFAALTKKPPIARCTAV